MSFSNNFTPVTLKNTNLFKPMQVGDMKLQHRAVMAPMTRMRAANNIPNKKWAVEYYDQRSQYPGTFIITEGTFVSRRAGGFDDAPGIWSQEQIDQWIKVIQKVHENKSFIYVQLWALGRFGSPETQSRDGLTFDAPSAEPYIDEAAKDAALKAKNPQHELTKVELMEYINDYVHAAKNAISAGADGVEIMAANGFFLNQFLDPTANQRTDEYGGSIENRGRFILEIVDAVVSAVGHKRVSIRFSPFGTLGNMDGTNPIMVAQYGYILGELEKRGRAGERLSYIHIIDPRVVNPFIPEKDAEYDLADSNFAYSAWSGNFVRAGNMASHPETVSELVKDNRTLICYGRFWISNPDLVSRLENGLPLNQYDRTTFYADSDQGYVDYPNYQTALKLGYSKN
ncbi:NADPH dehydrogenase 2 [Monosporozyma unispora]|nr:hypothetical protein C6P44_002451 [Kazachstania unispora]